MSTLPKLTIELIPKTAWYKNLRNAVPPEAWDRIRSKVYRGANYQCEICNKKGMLHCHEVWQYHDDYCIQYLTRMCALCVQCHQVKHVGLAEMNGKIQEVITHLMAINRWDRLTAETYVESSFQVWRERSQHKWTLVVGDADLKQTLEG